MKGDNSHHILVLYIRFHWNQFPLILKVHLYQWHYSYIITTRDWVKKLYNGLRIQIISLLKEKVLEITKLITNFHGSYRFPDIYKYHNKSFCEAPTSLLCYSRRSNRTKIFNMYLRNLTMDAMWSILEILNVTTLSRHK